MRIIAKLSIVFALISLLYPFIFITRQQKINEMQYTFDFLNNYSISTTHTNFSIRYHLNRVNNIMQAHGVDAEHLTQLNQHIQLINLNLMNWQKLINTNLTNAKTPHSVLLFLKKDLTDEANIANQIQKYLNEIKLSLTQNSNITSAVLTQQFAHIKQLLFNQEKIHAENMAKSKGEFDLIFLHVRIKTMALVMATFVLTFILSFILARVLIGRLKILKAAAERIVHKDYSAHINIASKDEVGILGQAFNDMIESINRSYKNIERMINALPSMFFLTDLKQNILKINDTACRILMIKPKQALHDNLTSLVPAADHVFLDKPTRAERIHFIGKNNNNVVALLSSTQLVNPETQENEFIYIAQDISLLEVMQQNAANVARIAGMSEVTSNVLNTVGDTLTNAGVSISFMHNKIAKTKIKNLIKLAHELEGHSDDIKTYLSTNNRIDHIYKYISELCRIWENDSEFLKEQINKLKISIREINEIIVNQQAEYKQAAIKEDISIKLLLEEVALLNEDAIKQNNIKINYIISTNKTVLIDRFKLLRVLNLLIKNSINSLVAKENHEPKLIEVEVTDYQDNMILIAISDNGLGMPAEAVAHIFEFTTDSDINDFQMHMIALNVIEMGGAITAKSTGLGTGTTINISVPLNSAVKKRIEKSHENIN